MSVELFSVATMSQPVSSFGEVPSSDAHAVVEAYLYSHTKIEEYRTVRGDRHVVTTFVLKTTVEPYRKSAPSDVLHEAEYLRQYQLDRLASGLIFGRTCESYDEAHDVMVNSETKSFY